MRPWLAAAIWIAWLLVATGAGYARSQAGDSIDDHATEISVRADVTTLVSMLGAVAAAITVPLGALPGDPWLSLGLGAALVLLGLGLRQWAALTLIPALACALIIVVTGLMARELGGGRVSQLVAGVAALFTLDFMATGSIFSMDVLDHLWWALASLIVAALLRRDAPACGCSSGWSPRSLS